MQIFDLQEEQKSRIPELSSMSTKDTILNIVSSLAWPNALNPQLSDSQKN